METGIYKKMGVSLGDVSFEDKYMVGMLYGANEPQDILIGIETEHGLNPKFNLRNATSDGHTVTGYVTEEDCKHIGDILVKKHN